MKIFKKNYQQMWLHQDGKILNWPREHPEDKAKVGPSIDVAYSEMEDASPSVRAALLGKGSAPQPTKKDETGMLVAECHDGNGFKSVVSLLVDHEVELVDAQQFATSASNTRQATFFEVYGRGGLFQDN